MPHALQFYKRGEYNQVLKYEEVEKPKITKDTHVLIKVHAAPVHPVDLGIITGEFPNSPKTFPQSPGLEGAGVVEEIGHSVTKVKVGQRVHFTVFGMWRDYVIVDFITDIVLSIPDSISFAEASQLSVNPLTVTQLVDDLNIKPNSGDYVIQSGAASSIGRFFIQYAKAKGFKTINIVRRQEQAAELTVLGADHVITSESENIVERVNSITQGAGAKYAVDCVGGAIGSEMLKALARGGVYITYGALAREDVSFYPYAFLTKGLVIKGFWLTSGMWRFDNPDSKHPAHHNEIINLLATKQITLTTKEFAAKDFAAAIEHSKAKGKYEKTILLFNQN